MRRQRWMEVRWTPGMRAITAGDSPCSSSVTARRRRRSSSAEDPLGLIQLLYTSSGNSGSFPYAGLSNVTLASLKSEPPSANACPAQRLLDNEMRELIDRAI